MEHNGRTFDNGQHLLLGAYQRSLAVIASLHGCGMTSALQRLPLLLQTAPRLATRLRVRRRCRPLHLLVAWPARGSDDFRTRGDDCVGWTCSSRQSPVDESWTVAELIAAQPAAARDPLWSPACGSAQRPAESVGHRVRGSTATIIQWQPENSSPWSRALIWTELLPALALREVATLGGELCLGAPVESVTRVVRPGDVSGSRASRRRLTPQSSPPGRNIIDWAAAGHSGLATNLASLRYEPISTLHFEFAYVFPG